MLGHYENIYLQYSMDGGGKEIWIKNFDIKKYNKVMNEQINLIIMGKSNVLVANEDKWKMINDLGKAAELCIQTT
jgi:hypothetical protein